MKYLGAEHPGLYERLILKGILDRHLADANEKATSMLEKLVKQIRSRAEEVIMHDVILQKHHYKTLSAAFVRQGDC